MLLRSHRKTWKGQIWGFKCGTQTHMEPITSYWVSFSSSMSSVSLSVSVSVSVNFMIIGMIVMCGCEASVSSLPGWMASDYLIMPKRTNKSASQSVKIEITRYILSRQLVWFWKKTKITSWIRESRAKSPLCAMKTLLLSYFSSFRAFERLIWTEIL